MSVILRTLGRALFASILLTSAYVMITGTQPQAHAAALHSGLDTIRGLNPALNFIPSSQ